MMQHDEYCQYVLSVLKNNVYPYMKKGIDPLDTMSSMMNQMSDSRQGLAMRIGLILTMLRQESTLPKGMTLTRKVPGGSTTASVKREFGLKKGLSKKRTYKTFSALEEVGRHLLQSGVEVYELYEFSDYHHWCYECDDGTMNYTYPNMGDTRSEEE
jgi:hypothetical protein